MNRKGDLIYWSIKDFQTTKQELTDLGYGHLIPRNDYRTSMIRALRSILRGQDKFYRKFKDTNQKVSFAVVNPKESLEDIEFKKEILVSLDKLTGVAQFFDKTGDNTAFIASVKDAYDHAQKTVDASQFRTLVLRVVKEDCHGFAMREGGGIYFVDKRFDTNRDRLSKLFEAFPGNTRVHSVPIYDDKGTTVALQDASSEEIFSEIEGLISDIQAKFEDGSMTRRALDGRKTDAVKILEKIKIHEEHLDSKAKEVRSRMKTVQEALEKVTTKVENGIFEPEDFYKELESLGKKK